MENQKTKNKRKKEKEKINEDERLNNLFYIFIIYQSRGSEAVKRAGLKISLS